MIKDCFLTVAYKQGWIKTYNLHNTITSKSYIIVDYCPQDGVGSFRAKSIHAAKLAITRWSKTHAIQN